MTFDAHRVTREQATPGNLASEYPGDPDTIARLQALRQSEDRIIRISFAGAYQPTREKPKHRKLQSFWRSCRRLGQWLGISFKRADG